MIFPANADLAETNGDSDSSGLPIGLTRRVTSPPGQPYSVELRPYFEPAPDVESSSTEAAATALKARADARRCFNCPRDRTCCMAVAARQRRNSVRLADAVKAINENRHSLQYFQTQVDAEEAMSGVLMPEQDKKDEASRRYYEQFFPVAGMLVDIPREAWPEEFRVEPRQEETGVFRNATERASAITQSAITALGLEWIFGFRKTTAS